ncbi:TPA: dATP/dGTP pyrophosphohydrolase domain-containing protein [Salmonella enterica subsp. enterica]
MTTITREQQKQILIDTANHVISRDNTSPYSENLRELARIALASLDAEPVRYLNKFSGTCVTLEQQPNAADDVAVYIPLYTTPPVPERERIRREHAEWSDKTFGDVGPVGPLKHLSKEALEAAAAPSDPLEWADMQFLLWDAQRRAGITDEQIALAMVEKLAVNKRREWPEPKDGEPRLHIKEQSAPVTQDGWISCSERMPDNDESKPIAIFTGKCLGQGMFVATYDDDGFFDYWEGMEIIGVSHWMPLPAPPKK